ncbi:hypothetical protein HK104_008496 [Borealophlyctis nickersoniae]|nr:hypothetical protein HK104_008496 [Borealophlyctis nickersoniae]
MNRQLFYLITHKDLVWGETGWRLRQSPRHCWRWAAGNGHLEIVRVLLKNGTDIHEHVDSALRAAARNGHLEVVELLLDNGADVHANDYEAMFLAAENGHIKVVRLLASKGEEQSDSALGEAASEWDEGVVDVGA